MKKGLLTGLAMIAIALLAYRTGSRAAASPGEFGMACGIPQAAFVMDMGALRIELQWRGNASGSNRLVTGHQQEADAGHQ